MKLKYNTFFKIFFVVALFISCISCSLTRNTNYNAIYFTDKTSHVISNDDIKRNSILEVNSFLNLTSTMKKQKIAIIIDKSIINNTNEISKLKPWLRNQKDCPIIVIGYSNPTYVFFKVLDITNGENMPKIDDNKYKLFKNEYGYCLAYIFNSGKIDGKQYNCKYNVNIKNIMAVITQCQGNQQSVNNLFGDN